MTPHQSKLVDRLHLLLRFWDGDSQDVRDTFQVISEILVTLLPPEADDDAD